MVPSKCIMLLEYSFVFKFVFIYAFVFKYAEWCSSQYCWLKDCVPVDVLCGICMFSHMGGSEWKRWRGKQGPERPGTVNTTAKQTAVGYPALLDYQEILNTSIYSTNTEFSSLEMQLFSVHIMSCCFRRKIIIIIIKNKISFSVRLALVQVPRERLKSLNEK